MEIVSCKNDVIDAITKLEDWNETKVYPQPMISGWGMDLATTEQVPFGLALIIGAWNYPIYLTIGPLVPAIAAGNCVILKPSEISANTSAMLANLLNQYLDPECYRVVLGGIPETTLLLEQKFDLIFYTGNGMVAKIIAAQAAKTLTPCVFELGGKCPVLIDKDVDVKSVARRMIWAKVVNCGQTCVAPDYILVHDNVHDQFVQESIIFLNELCPQGFEQSDFYSRIISNRQFDRLDNLLQSQLKVPGCSLVFGGEKNRSKLLFGISIIDNVSMSISGNPIMQEEIFGPILPIIRYSAIDDAVKFINSGWFLSHVEQIHYLSIPVRKIKLH